MATTVDEVLLTPPRSTTSRRDGHGPLRDSWTEAPPSPPGACAAAPSC